MNIKIIKYTQNDEILESVHFQDDHGNDYLVLPYYINSTTTAAEKNLRLGIDSLPQMLKEVYTAGKKGENFNMSIEEVQV